MLIINFFIMNDVFMVSEGVEAQAQGTTENIDTILTDDLVLSVKKNVVEMAKTNS